MPAPPVATTRSDWRMSSWVAAMDGSAIVCTRSAGAPTCSQAPRMYSTTAAVDRLVRGWGAITMALRPFRANSALTGGVASGPVVGINAATTPTGLAIFVRPRSGSSSTTPTVSTPRMSARTPSTRLLILVTLSEWLPKPPSSTASPANASARSLRATAQASAVTRSSTCSCV